MVASGPLRQRSGRLTLLGAPVDGGANIPGSFLGPSALRMIGLASMLACKAVDPDNVFLLGIRSVDAGEGEVLRSRGVNMVDMREIRQNGLTTSIRRVLETVAKRDGVLHVSLDADFVDPSFTPGVNVPVSGGVTYAEAHLTMQMLNESGLVASLDVAELNPLLDSDGRSTRVIAELVACLFDQKAKSRHDYSRQEGRYGHNAA